MTEAITVYEKPTCSKCREMVKLLKENGSDFEKVNYYNKPFTKSKLKSLLAKMNMPAKQLLRTNEHIYKELKLAQANLSDEQLIDLMVQHPDLIQRPIVEKGDRAVLGRPTENVNRLLS
jgi:arsenate reductase